LLFPFFFFFLCFFSKVAIAKGKSSE